MPSILRVEGFDFRIYFNDHLPAHVHVFKAEGQAKISIGSVSGLPELLQVKGMSRGNAKRSLELVVEYQDVLLAKWEEIHE
jgi:Domain of unknown function (DUF4160)